MRFCDQPVFERWSPDFSSSGLANPVWTRAKCDGSELCNSLEWTDWEDDPVQVQLCDACGTPGCASGGYARISALAGFVLWTPPRLHDNKEQFDFRMFSANALEKFGSILISPRGWASFRAE